MKKEDKLSGMNLSELTQKREQLLKNLVIFKVSLSKDSLAEFSSVGELKKELRSLGRRIAQMSLQNGKGVGV